jgi:hypothetical protein
MKRILLTVLAGALLFGQLEAAQYQGTYYTPNALQTGNEKIEAKGGILEQPGLSWIEKATNIKKDRSGKMLKFDITKKMSGDGWEIKQGTDENNQVKFTLCLERKRFLPGGLQDKGWGPLTSGKPTYQDNMICFDLSYDQIEEKQ